MKNRFQAIQLSDVDANGKMLTASFEMTNPLNNIIDWPISLPGWKTYPRYDDSDDSFPRLVDNPKRDLTEAINVLKAELDDQSTPPPGPTGPAA